jgi:hypothetical protein
MKIDPEYKKQLRNHCNRNITYLLDILNVRFTEFGVIQAKCPCKQHGGDRDNDTAFSWRTDLGKWVCWTHHCEEERGNDIFGLVSSVLGTNFYQTFDWLEKRMKERRVDVTTAVAPPENSTRNSSIYIHEPISEENLRFLIPDPEFLLERGFDRDVLRSYEMGMWQRPFTYMNDRAVFPIRDHDGFLIGYTGRTIHPKEFFQEKEVRYAKWLHGRHFNRKPKRGEFKISSILYNFFRAKQAIKASRRAILLEGPLDGMKLAEAKIRNWVGNLGTSFCYPQRTLLVEAGVTDVYVAYDDDPAKGPKQKKAGEEGFKRAQRVIGDLMNVHRVAMPPLSDCGSMSVEQILETFEGIGC